MSRTINFNAGPAALPIAALERAREELLDFEGSGMSVMEHSHRGKVYEKVHNEATSLVAELLGTPLDTWDVLFVQGGASLAFAQIPMNFLPAGAVGDYIVNGAWGEKAIAEAKTMKAIGGGEPHLAASTKNPDKSYLRVSRQEELQVTEPSATGERAAYVHVTSNETIHGVEYALTPETPFPRAEAPVFVDMSSDILGRAIDASQFDLIYAGAQKNIGPSGVTIVALKKELTARGRKDIPTILQYRTAADNQSLYNTPPTFGIYLVRNTLSWLKSEGGIAGMEARNRKKAKVIYDAIDASGGFYRCPVEPASRSIMNVVWRLPTEALEETFVKEATAQKMIGLKGHRSAGGIRASLYNAVEPAWCDALASFMKDFAKKNG
jgi:phosphoserine aminotransferase